MFWRFVVWLGYVRRWLVSLSLQVVVDLLASAACVHVGPCMCRIPCLVLCSCCCSGLSLELGAGFQENHHVVDVGVVHYEQPKPQLKLTHKHLIQKSFHTPQSHSTILLLLVSAIFSFTNGDLEQQCLLTF